MSGISLAVKHLSCFLKHFKVTPTTFYEISKTSHICSIFCKSICLEFQGIKNQQFHKGQNTKAISLRGKGLQEVRKYFQSVSLEGSQPKNIFINVGSNDVLNDTAENFIKEYETLIEEIKFKFQDSKLFVSLIIRKVNNEHFNKKSAYFNKLLKEMSRKMSISFIPHHNIKEENLLRSDGTHLSERDQLLLLSPT